MVLVTNAGMDGHVIDIFVQNVVDGFAHDVFWEAMNVVYLNLRSEPDGEKSQHAAKVRDIITSPHYLVT